MGTYACQANRNNYLADVDISLNPNTSNFWTAEYECITKTGTQIHFFSKLNESVNPINFRHNENARVSNMLRIIFIWPESIYQSGIVIIVLPCKFFSHLKSSSKNQVHLSFCSQEAHRPWWSCPCCSWIGKKMVWLKNLAHIKLIGSSRSLFKNNEKATHWVTDWGSLN